MTKATLVVLLGLLTMNTRPALEPQEPGAVDVKVTTVAGLQQFAQRQHGKVVLVYFWAEIAAPEKRIFRDILAMHKRLGRDGLVTVSVSVDDMDETPQETLTRIRSFLKSENATIPNFVLDDPVEDWMKLTKVSSPCFLIFGRDGNVERTHVSPSGKGDLRPLEQKLIQRLREGRNTEKP